MTQQILTNQQLKKKYPKIVYCISDLYLDGGGANFVDEEYPLHETMSERGLSEEDLDQAEKELADIENDEAALDKWNLEDSYEEEVDRPSATRVLNTLMG